MMKYRLIKISSFLIICVSIGISFNPLCEGFSKEIFQSSIKEQTESSGPIIKGHVYDDYWGETIIAPIRVYASIQPIKFSYRTTSNNDGYYEFTLPSNWVEIQGIGTTIIKTCFNVPVYIDDSEWIKIKNNDDIITVDLHVMFQYTCLEAGTKITMEDGSRKYIEDVKVGDKILSYDVKKNEFSSWSVKATGAPKHFVYSINNGLLNLTHDHPIYIKKSDNRKGIGAIIPEKAGTRLKQKVLPVEIGDYTYKSNGELIQITNITPISKPVRTYNLLSYSSRKTYFANDILVYEDNPPIPIWIRFYMNKLLRIFLKFL